MNKEPRHSYLRMFYPSFIFALVVAAYGSHLSAVIESDLSSDVSNEPYSFMREGDLVSLPDSLNSNSRSPPLPEEVYFNP